MLAESCAYIYTVLLCIRVQTVFCQVLCLKLMISN